MKITKAELKQIVVEETKKVLIKQRILNEDWNKVLQDSAIEATSIETFKNLKDEQIKNILDNDEYLKKFLILLYYVEGYKEREGPEGFTTSINLEDYLSRDNIDSLEQRAKEMARDLDTMIAFNREKMGYYHLFDFLRKLSDYERDEEFEKVVKNIKKRTQDPDDEPTRPG